MSRLQHPLFGHASRVDPSKLAAEFSEILVEGEEIDAAYRLVRDMFVFTTRRILVLNRQGMTGRKTSTLSLPYREVSASSSETAGTFDADAELRIWLRGRAGSLKWDFPRGGEIAEIHRTLARRVL